MMENQDELIEVELNSVPVYSMENHWEEPECWGEGQSEEQAVRGLVIFHVYHTQNEEEFKKKNEKLFSRLASQGLEPIVLRHGTMVNRVEYISFGH